jgi:WD40 repeat protein
MRTGEVATSDLAVTEWGKSVLPKMLRRSDMRSLPIRFVVLVLLSLLVLAGCGQPAPGVPGSTVYTYRGHSSGISKVVWLPDGKYIVSQDFGHNINVWEAMTGKLVRSFSTGSDSSGGFALSPDGKYIAAGFADHTIKVLDIMTGSTLLTHMGDVDTIGWSPDGKYIASSDNLTMQVWDAKTGVTALTYKILPKIEGDTHFVLAWSPDSKYIAVGGNTKTVLVLAAITGKVISTYNGHTEVGAYPYAWSPDGRYIISTSWDLTTQVWEAMTGKHIHTFQGLTPSISWSPNGKYIALGTLGDEHVQVCDTSTWSLQLTYEGHSGNGNVVSTSWSPDSKYIASGSDDKTVQVWRAP